ncbi:MAG: hypothetical protein ABIQ15_00140 [Nocardioides sp.]
MIIEGVDPRDIAWEVDHPPYRVYFWRHGRVPAGTAPVDVGYAADEYRLSGVTDVDEALTWARAKATPEQSFTLYVEDVRDGRRGLIRLAGTDPTVMS